jgi:hypothetical protein
MIKSSQKTILAYRQKNANTFSPGKAHQQLFLQAASQLSRQVVFMAQLRSSHALLKSRPHAPQLNLYNPF